MKIFEPDTTAEKPAADTATPKTETLSLIAQYLVDSGRAKVIFDTSFQARGEGVQKKGYFNRVCNRLFAREIAALAKIAGSAEIAAISPKALGDETLDRHLVRNGAVARAEFRRACKQSRKNREAEAETSRKVVSA